MQDDIGTKQALREKQQDRQMLVNAGMSILQTLVIGISTFLLYRFLLEAIGPEQLGVWSLILATTMVTRIGDLGLSSSVVKFVAKYVAQGELKLAQEVIQTALISIGFFAIIALLIVYGISGSILDLVVPAHELEAALSILPYALASLFVSMLTGVLQSGLDGFQRIDLRSLILTGGKLFHLILALAIVPAYGLMGLAYAQIIQAVVVLLASWGFLREQLNTLPILPHKWNFDLFREMVGYGFNLQIISVAQLAYEPTTTALLSRFGGLTAVAYFEMARRMVRQIRSLIVSANQVLVPFIADRHERAPGSINAIYGNSYRLLIFVAMPLFSFAIAATPIISEIWIGHYESTFVVFSTLLALGWFLNTLNAPAYFANMGTGELRWNTVSGVVIALVNAGLGVILGSGFGGLGVVIAWIVALVLGSFLVNVPYHRSNGISLRRLFPRENFWILLASVAGIIITVVFYFSFQDDLSSVVKFAAITSMYGLVVLVPIWLHPMRKNLTRWVFRQILSSPLRAE